MKNRLIQLSKGTIEYRVPDISLETEVLTGTVLPGKHLSMDVSVVSKNACPMHLFFYSENPRITVSQPLSIGRTGKFTVQINASGLPLFEKIEGQIDIVYNGGEIALPYVFQVGFVREFRTDKPLTTLDEFFDFAAERREDAEKLFSWNDFLNLPFMQDLHLHALYHTYYSGTKKDAGLSEFLKAAGMGKKRALLPKDLMPGKRGSDVPALTSADYAARRLLFAERFFLEFDRILKGDGAGRKENFERIEKLANSGLNSPVSDLLYAYVCMENRKADKARSVLIRTQDPIQKERLRKKDVYGLFQYLVARVSGDEEERENAEALIHRYFSEGTSSALLYMLEYRLTKEYASDTEKAQEFLKSAYTKGIRAAWVSQETVYLWMRGNADVPLLTEYELTAVLYGLRHGILSEKKLFEIMSGDLKNPRLLNLYMTVLKTGFLKFGHTDLLHAVVNVYMQQKTANRESMPWYRAAVSENLAVQGLYEYYLASLPKAYDEPIQESVIRYFGMGSSYQGAQHAVLYLNVLRYYREDPEILGMYDKRIRELAYTRLRREEFAVHELPLYSYILETEGVNQENANLLKPLFYLTEVLSEEDRANRLLIHYPEVGREVSYPFEQGKALVPVYTGEAVIALENSRGVRIADPDMKIRKVFDYPEYRRQCILLTSPTVLQRIAEIEEKLAEGPLRESDVFLLTEIIRDKNLDPFFRDRMYEVLIGLNERQDLMHLDCTQFLMDADSSTFSRPYRVKLIGILISRGYYRVAYQRVMETGTEGLSPDALYDLAVHMIEEPVLEGNQTLRCILYQLYLSGRTDGRILDYLARFYNGTSGNMEKLAKTVRKKRVPAYDLYERALTVCFYTAEDRDIDTLFEWYAGQNLQNTVLRQAYLVYRSYTYFKHGKKLTETAAEALKKEAAVLPDVCLMAALTYLAQHADSLKEDEKALTENLLLTAVRKNIFLGCFEKFEHAVRIPQELEGRVYLEYRSDTAREVSVIGQILPERHYFHGTMHRVYPGVFVRSYILYTREWIQYYFNVQEEDGTVSEQEGPLVFKDEADTVPGSRYEDMMKLDEVLQRGDWQETASFMRGMLQKTRMVETIFAEDL